MCKDLLELPWNDELFMQTKWCAAIKWAESTHVSCVTLMACLRFIHQPVSLSVCLSAVWLCRTAGRAKTPGPGRPWSGGARGHAAELGANHHTRHRLHSVLGLWYLAPGRLQRWKRNWNGLLPHHRHRWVPWALPAAEPCNSNLYNPHNTNLQQTAQIWGMSQSQFSEGFNSQGKCRLIKVKLNITKIRTSALSCHAPEWGIERS